MTNRIRLTLLALAAVLLTPTVALAQTADLPALVAAWGQWPLFVGVGVSLLIEAWRRVKPQVFDQFSPLAKRLVPLLVAGLGAGAAALMAGADWSQAGIALLSAWGMALATGDTLRALLDLVLKKEASAPALVTNDEDLDELAACETDNAKPNGTPPLPPAA